MASAAFVATGFFVSAGSAQATTFYSTSLENQACDSRSSPVDGKTWNYEYDTQGHVRCAPLDAPDGSKYYAGENVTSSVGAAISIPLTPTSIVSGTTYYLAGVWRFDRIASQPIWHNLWDFDKLHEMNYSSATGFRWIIESGYPDSSTVYHANQFTFAAYGSDAIFPGWTYYDHNLNGYSRTAPYWCDYERWYSVVMGITAHQSNGRVRMWINGTQVMDHTGVVTMLAGATLEAIAFSMTVGQPEYDAPSHNRYLDRMMLTDNFADITNAGYLSDPQAGGDTTPPAAPTSLAVE